MVLEDAWCDYSHSSPYYNYVPILRQGPRIRAGADDLGTENLGDLSSTAEKANCTDTPQLPEAPNENVLFFAVTKLNACLTRPHVAVTAHIALLLVSGHSDPRKISALAARPAEYQASQDQSGSVVIISGSGGAMRWSSANERARGGSCPCAMWLLFVGVKT